MSASQKVAFAGPLHEQVHRVLRSRILSGEWARRQPLPGEADLARALGVSIGTVRKAMERLSRDHLVVRERGRGTFVRMLEAMEADAGFHLTDCKGRDLAPTIEIIDRQMQEASPAEAMALALGHDACARPRVLRVVRAWSAGGICVCQETILVEAEGFAGLLERAALDAPALHSLYETAFSIRVDRLVWSIGAAGTIAIGDNASVLPPHGDEPVLAIRRTALDARALPVEVCELAVRSSLCRVVIGR